MILRNPKYFCSELWLILQNPRFFMQMEGNEVQKAENERGRGEREREKQYEEEEEEEEAKREEEDFGEWNLKEMKCSR